MCLAGGVTMTLRHKIGLGLVILSIDAYFATALSGHHDGRFNVAVAASFLTGLFCVVMPTGGTIINPPKIIWAVPS